MFSGLKKDIKSKILSGILTINLNDRSKNSILITFDDGPNPATTLKVLDRLKEYHARSIFFIPGVYIYKAPILLRTIIEQGHLIGNHSFIHSNDRQPVFWKYYLDIKKCQNEIMQNIGIMPMFFRPPGGRISLKSTVTPKLLGLKTILWSLDAGDWKCKTRSEADYCADYIKKNIQPGDILLLHDENPFVLDILDNILPELKAREFDLFSGINFI